jgi:hypothetical protein
MSIVENIRRTLGGKWKYDGTCSWWCQDGRHVTRCSAGVDEWDNPLGPAEYWLYHPKGSGNPPERAEKYICNQRDNELLAMFS